MQKARGVEACVGVVNESEDSVPKDCSDYSFITGLRSLGIEPSKCENCESLALSKNLNSSKSSDRKAV